MRASAPYHSRKRPYQNRKIEPQRPVFDVLPVEPHYLLEVDHAAAAPYLARARDPRLRTQPPEVMILVAQQVRLEERPRPDERHVADQHVPQLRQLVQAPPPEYASQLRHPRIVRDLEQTRIAGVVQVCHTALLGVGAVSPGAELEHPESSSTQPHTHL